jgi:hypothetical protein
MASFLRSCFAASILPGAVRGDSERTVAHQVIGFVQTQNMLTVDIDDSIFPFNMEGSDVARN